jgi:hypothetical protein
VQEPERDPLSTIAAVLGRLDERSEGIQADISEVKEHQIEQNGRITALERWVQRIVGGTALLGLMAPLFLLGIRESIVELFK